MAKKLKTSQKMFVVRKYVLADSVESALKKERATKVHEVYVDDEWRKGNQDRLANAIGFVMLPPDEHGRQ